MICELLECSKNFLKTCLMSTNLKPSFYRSLWLPELRENFQVRSSCKDEFNTNNMKLFRNIQELSRSNNLRCFRIRCRIELVEQAWSLLSYSRSFRDGNQFHKTAKRKYRELRSDFRALKKPRVLVKASFILEFSECKTIQKTSKSFQHDLRASRTFYSAVLRAFITLLISFNYYVQSF